MPIKQAGRAQRTTYASVRSEPARETNAQLHTSSRDTHASPSERNDERESIMKPENAARRAIIREWMLLPTEKRQSEEQAAAFTLKAIEKHEIPGAGDR